MKKNILVIAILASFGAQATDVIISSNDTLIQDSGKLSDSGFQVTDNKFINVDGVLETNIPNSFYFRVGNDYANTIVYDKNSAINPFSNMRTLHQFLGNQIGQPVTYKKEDAKVNATIHKVIGDTLFLKKEDNSIFTAKLNNIELNESVLDAKNFNLTVSFNNKDLMPDDNYHYSYFANGFNWYPNYTVTMKDGNKMDFTFYGNISNNTQSDLNDINLTLMTQENQNVFPVEQRQQKMKTMAFSSMEMAADTSMGNVSSQNIEDLTAYKIDGKVDLKSGIASNILIKEFKDVEYNKYNQISLPTLNINSIEHYFIQKDRLKHLTQEGIIDTKLVVEYKDNKELTKDYIPNGSVTVMKQDNSNGKDLLIPYNKTSISSVKKEDFSVHLPKNKNVKYLSNIKEENHLELLDEKEYKQNRVVMIEKNYRITYSQHIENNSDKAETFVLYLSEQQARNSVFPKAYTKELIADKGQYQYTVTLPKNSKKDFKIQTKIKTINKKRK